MGLLIDQDIASRVFLSHYEIQRPVDWSEHYRREAPLEVEIGSGLGEYLVRLAQTFPGRNFVGIEQEWERVKKICRRIEAVARGASGQPLENVKILQIDAAVAFERLFKPQSIDRVHCLFPCPWPKKKHVQHRLFSQHFLKLVNSRVKNQGTLKLVTDHEPYLKWVLEEIPQTGWDFSSSVIAPQFDTKFERKWREQGQEKFFNLELIKKEHVDVALAEDVELKVYFTKNFEPKNFRVAKVTGKVAIVLKDFLFDTEQQKGLVHLVVKEESITQHVWVMISRIPRGWCIAKMEGQTLLPTQGVVQAIEQIYQGVLQSC
ncbi:MAG: hypothetical protein NUV91_08315 [Candidatus Omnitrophica bacterium]|nr:hypothetical protein [Candidatus Omnitrophota bacterium]